MDARASHRWKGEIRRYRDTLLNYLLLAETIGGGIALLLLCVPVVYKEPLEQLALVPPFLAGWLVVLLAWLLRKRLGYLVRVWILLLLVYGVGCYLLYTGGLSGSGRIWLLLLPALAVVLLDLWPGGVLVGVFSVLTYALFAFTICLEAFPFEPADVKELGYWASEGGDFLIAVIGLAVVIWAFSRGWQGALGGLSVANKQLEEAMADLQILNAQLDLRVVERTRQLAEALGKNEAILQSIADGVIVFDLNGRAVATNPAMSALLGRPVDEIVGLGVEALIGEGADTASRERASEMLRHGQTSQSGFKFQWEDKMFAVSLAPIRDASSEVTGTVAVFRDFTHEAEIDRMKSTFVAIASHDLRTPLNAILGYIEMLQEGMYGPLSEEQLDTVGRIAANITQMLSLASNLLDRAQIESGTLELNVFPFSPGELVDEVVGAMEVLARSRGLELTGEVGAEVPDELSGDRQRLSQILINLVGNAIKFTDEGGLHVRAYLPDAGHWVLEVSDTGRGIAVEDQTYVFDPFRQAGDLSSRRRGGAGLGLYIVKQIVDVMGGEVMLESEVGQGSTFTIVLPLVADERSRRDAPSES